MKEDNDLNTSLAVAGNSNLGRELILAALETNRSDAQKKVIESVKKLLASIEDQKGYIESATKSIAVLNRRLKLIEAGEFTISRNGELVLNDKDIAPLGLDK